MLKITKVMHVDAEPGRVLSFLIDSSVMPPGMSMEVLHESPDHVGDSYAWSFKVLGVPLSGVTVVTDYVPGDRVSFRNLGAMESTGTWTVAPEDGGTRAIARIEARMAFPLIGRLFDPVLRRGLDTNIAWAIRELEREQPKVVAAA